MGLQIASREAGDVTVLVLDGRLVMGRETQSLSDHVRRLLAENKTSILLNIEKVSYIDSSGVGELVACQTTAKKNGGVLKIASPCEFVSDVLRAVRLIDVLDLYATEAEALASFAG